MLDSDPKSSPTRAVFITLACTALLIGFWHFQTADPNTEESVFTIWVGQPNAFKRGDMVVVDETVVGSVVDVTQRTVGQRVRVRAERQYRYLMDRRMTHQIISETDKQTSRTLQLIPGTPPGPLIDDGDHLGTAQVPPKVKPRVEKNETIEDAGVETSTTQVTAIAALNKADAAIAVDAAPAPVEKRFRIALRRVSVADSKLNGKAWDVLEGAPDLVFEAWCGDTNILQSARYANTYDLELGPHDLTSEVFSWPEGQSVGIRVVDRDLRNDDTIGSVVLPASAREITGTKTIELTRENLVTFGLTITAIGE